MVETIIILIIVIERLLAQFERVLDKVLNLPK